MGAEYNLVRDFERENHILLDAEKQTVHLIISYFLYVHINTTPLINYLYYKRGCTIQNFGFILKIYTMPI